MPLKYKYPTQQEIPAEQQALYVEREGAFYLDIEGVVEKAKADELRTHNIELRKQIEERDARFEGIDPEAVRQLAAEKARLEEEQRLKDGKFQEVLADKLKAQKADADKQLTSVTGERDAYFAQLTAIQIDQGVLTAATKRGLRSTALPDITARARQTFKLVNGVPRAFEPDGKTKGIVWVGVLVFLFGLATLFYPPLKLLVGSVTTSAAITVGGLALIVLPTLIVGNELLIMGGVAAAVGIWFLAHRHGQLRGLVDASNNSETKGGI